MEKAELLKTLDELQEVLKDYNKFIYILSKDEGKRTLAKTVELTSKIKWLLDASETKDVIHPDNSHFTRDRASFVKVRPCGKEYGDKTYLGILLGDMACGSSASIEGDKIKLSWVDYNPAIFVPDLHKIIFGYQSWWSEIKGPDNFKEISNSDIENTWYVKMFKGMSKEGNKEESHE